MNSLIRSSSTIHKAITERMAEMGATQAQVINDASELGFTIFKPQLSNYLNKTKKYGLTEVQILFICSMYGINININAGRPYLDGDIIKYKLTPYSKKNAARWAEITKQTFGL